MSCYLTVEYNKIYTFCYFKVKNREVAEDITQETFLKYFSTTDYLERGKKLAFLYTIARNCCIDYFRKTKNIINIDDLSGEEIQPVEETQNLETSIVVQAAVSQLNHEHQEIVLLRFTNELGVGEIAQYLGISRFAVYRKLNSIEKELKISLRKEDFYG
ncbi:RNA polymerase subunit sigma-24 [Candidatus Epulonipiscioides gigas]|nr:RNA polymerase subunit sigma-24 [Epulopiscium sp. SCG-C07WGA-EpuloA2]